MRILPIIVILFAMSAALRGAECVAVTSDKIVAADLFDVVPQFHTLDPRTPVGFSPLPGTERLFSGHELMLLLRRQGAVSDPALLLPGVCVQRAANPIAKDDMKAALVAALGMPGAELELVEFSTQPVPQGRLEFKRSGLTKSPSQNSDLPVIWRGRLIYDGQHSASVWAKVIVLVDCAVFVATSPIAAGAVIDAGQVKEIHERQFPFSALAFASAGEITGKIARRNIAGGQKILPSMLDEQKDVSRGDKVQVRVLDGLAYLSFDGVAVSAGKKGDNIFVHNSAGGRNFRAVIEEKGKVLVRSSPGE